MFKFKMNLFLVFFGTLLYLENVNTSKLPSVFSPCSQSDPELNACMKTGVQYGLNNLWKGLPELGLRSFDPLKLANINGNVGDVLKIQFSDVVISGIKDSKLLDWKINQKKKKMKFSIFNSPSMQSKYKADGRLLILPVVGDGDCYVKIKDLTMNYTLSFETVKGQDGKDHWKIKKKQVSYEPQGVVFDFTNLFNGNKLLSDELIRFSNENWREIFNEVATPVMEDLIKTILGQIQEVFDVLPLEDYFLP